MFYRIGRLLLRVALWIYFRRVEVAGREHLPPRGPVILAANHPQSITDALILGLISTRTVHFLAHSGLFANRWRAFFLRQAGVLPVHRPRDDPRAGAHNVNTFAACAELLASGGCIGIFPEGTSHEEPRVQALRTGTARIALESEAARGFTLGVKIVPVGLSFESPRHFRSRVLVTLGPPFEARDYRAAYADDRQASVRDLTRSLGERIRAQVRHIERDSLTEVVRDIESVYRDELVEGEARFDAGMSSFHRRQIVEREIARAVDFFFENDPEAIWRLGVRLHKYRRQLRRCRLSDDMIRLQEDPAVEHRFLRLALLTLLAAPIALYGLLFNYVPYRLTGIGARRLAAHPTKVHWNQLMVGALVYLLYYPLLLVAAHRLFAGAWPRTLAFAAALLPTGLFARWYLYRRHRELRMLRFAWFSTVHRTALRQLRRARRSLLVEMDALTRRYEAARELQQTPQAQTTRASSTTE